MRVSVAIVTFNSSRYIGPCLESVFRQEGTPFDVTVVDNASTDGTADILAGYGGRIRTIRNQRNLGFAAAQNQAIASSSGDWVLALNPDVLLEPGFLRETVAAGQVDPGVGTVCGRLRAIGAGFTPLPTPLLDSTGMFFTPSMRHFDRGWHTRDDGRFREIEYVFGASAAAALYRREMICDVAPDGEFFDPDFFAYREDADLAWRAQLLGWQCLYTPSALAYHVRSVVPNGRRAVPAVLNMHSVKNRFLMRIKNATPGLYLRYWLPMTARDLLVAGGCVFCEPSSLPAFWHLARALPRALRRRREIMRRRRASDESICAWFDAEPSSQPFPRRRLLARQADILP